MIIDYRTDPRHASRHRVIRLPTGGQIEGPYFYADDRIGLLMRYRKEAGPRGRPIVQADRRTGSPLVDQEWGSIRIIPAEGSSPDGEVLWACRRDSGTFQVTMHPCGRVEVRKFLDELPPEVQAGPPYPGE